MIERDEELVDIGRRIELLTLEPDSIAAPLTRLFSPLLYRVGWRPKTKIDAIEALVTRIARRGLVDPAERRAPEPAPVTLLRAAIAELEGNLVQLERATVITKRPLIAHAAL